MAGACGTTDLLSTCIKFEIEMSDLKLKQIMNKNLMTHYSPRSNLQICCWELMIVNQELPLHPLGFHEKHNGIEYSGYVDPML